MSHLEPSAVPIKAWGDHGSGVVTRLRLTSQSWFRPRLSNIVVSPSSRSATKTSPAMDSDANDRSQRERPEQQNRASSSKQRKSTAITETRDGCRAGPVLIQCGGGETADYGGLYPPLQAGQIRLFTIAPRETRDDELRLTLRVCRLLDVDDDYIAISSTWLDEVFSVTAQEQRSHVSVICNGRPHARATRLWPLLERLNGKLQYMSLSSDFWLDAICINQDDQAERGHQAALMGEIYSAASIVYAYIGAEPEARGSKGDDVDVFATVLQHDYFSRS